ncbi:MAG: phosphomethylpyrimidine synthase ThiC [Bacteroidales bacterium]|nr:phosphomethylpyrimidine synthase ThiC [Bacteroidales bacterium]
MKTSRKILMTDSFKLKARNNDLGIGKEFPIRVNCNVGINNPRAYTKEIKKIDEIFKQKESSPDLMMDLSTVDTNISLYKYIIDKYKIPVGTLPVYLSYSNKTGIKKKSLLKNIEKQAKQGVSFFTFHFTADLELYKIAKNSRLIPMTSRGGGMVLHDSVINNRQGNILLECFEEIISIVKKYNVAISLGTTFRPAGIIDALDEVHLLETQKQIELSQLLRNKDINVIIENVGHIDLSSIEKHSQVLIESNCPIMPLGPLPTDNAEGVDHISSAIGAAFSGYFNCANIINSISPNEHLKSHISVKDAIDGIIAAKIAAHSVNILKFKDIREIDNAIYKSRAKEKSCLSEASNNCDRCNDFCPLKIMSI